MDALKALKIIQLRQNPGVLTRVARRLKVSVQFVSDVYYGKMHSRNRRVERELAREGMVSAPVIDFLPKPRRQRVKKDNAEV